MTLSVALIMLLQSAGAAPAGDDGVTFIYENLPPYAYQQDGKTSGLYPKAVNALLDGADIDYNWQQLNYVRLRRTIENADYPVCLVGYPVADTDQRQYYRSPPIMYQVAHVVVYRAGDEARFDTINSFSELVDQNNLVGGFIAKGRYNNSQTAELVTRGNHLTFYGDDQGLIKLLDAGRIDFAIIDQLQIRHAQKTLNLKNGLETKVLDEFLEARTEFRHIVCTAQISDKLKRALDDVALLDVGGTPFPGSNVLVLD